MNNKNFLQMVLAVVVGILAVGIICSMMSTCAFVGMIAAASGSDDDLVKTQDGDIMVLKINGPVDETAPSMPFAFDMLGGLTKNEEMGLRGYLNAIAIAKADKNIAGIYLNTDGMAAAPATYEALHNALVDFRADGKWIIAYNDNYTLGQYYVASAADSVYVNIVGGLELDGMTSLLPYPKGLLDKLGIEMQVFRVGSFKSAVEPYMVEHISDANRLQTETYLRNIWNQMMHDIALQRDVTVEQLDSLANLAVSYMQPEELATTGLVDSLLYKTDVEQILLRKMGQTELKGHAHTASKLMNNYDHTFPTDGKEKVAVLYAVGEITSGPSEGFSEEGIYWESIIKDIRAIADDDDIKALVLRVNSPGGSGFASEQIWKALMDLKAKKPLVVSMGDYAASGGYYISVPAQYIVAEPNTLTGSIGVFGVIPNFSGLATGKLGVNFEEVKTHNFGKVNSMRAVTAAEREQVQRGINAFYELFTKRCAEGRAMEQDSIKAVAGGRVWTGSDAIRLGLVDELGGLQVAVAKAAELAGLEADKYCTVNYPEPEAPMASILKMLKQESEDVTLRIADQVMGTTPADRSTLRFLRQLQQADRIQVRSFDTVIL